MKKYVHFYLINVFIFGSADFPSLICHSNGSYILLTLSAVLHFTEVRLEVVA
jgi:hypothetical protein